jgi:2-haloacid dehalogenase
LELEKRLVTPDALKVRRFEVLLRRLGIDHPATNFSDLYLECLAGCSELVDGARQVLEALSSSCRFAIVTNGLRAVQRSRVERSAIRDLISEIIISEEIGHAKPACEFFQVAFERLGLPPKSEVLLVGDSWSSDIQGAANYGIDACWYNPGRKPRPEAPTISCEIASLRELVDLLIG